MSIQKTLKKHKMRNERAQAIVEFAITLPILMLLLVGILEAGRAVFVYASINNASREAARYASAVGRGDNGLLKYKDCASIRNLAKRAAFFARISDSNIQIQYYRPNKDSNGNDVIVSGALSEVLLAYECDATSGEDADVVVKTGDRVKITIRAPYSPVIRLIPLRARTFISQSSRTILGVFSLDN